MKLKDTIFISLAPLITIPTSVAISSAINNSNETNTRILTFHNLPNEFYDLIKNTQIKRNIALDRDELLLAKYETKAIPLDTKSISIYYDAGFENTVRFLDNIADRDGRRIEITYDENIDFNSEEANKIKNLNMFYKKLDIKRTAFSYALIEKKTNAEKYMNTVLQDYKYIVRQLAFENVKINEKQAEALLSSEAIISPKINHDSYYGWENGVAKHINHLGLYDSVIPLHFENRKYSKSSLNSSGIQNILLEKAKSKIADNEDILINETKIEKDYQVVVKAFILSDNENKNQRDWLPYAPNMIINNNRQLRDNFILWEDNLKLNVEIYAPQTNYVVINNDNAKISQIVSNYEKAFLKAQNELKNTQTLNIVSERIGDRTLYSLENQSLLNQKINEINKKLMEYNFFIEYKVIDEDKIDLYLSNKTNSLINKSYKIASNYPVKISPSVRAIDKEIKNRLIIKANKWVDFKTNTTELVDDVPVLLEPQAKKGEKSFYGGKWLYHSPASVDFTTIDESEILLINGKRIEVLDRHFSEILSNESLIIDNSSKEEENKIKSYEIKILKYEKNSGNVDSKLEYEYKIDLLINSNALSIDYKFYAWNPEENPDQKKLIEEYKKDANGNLLKDEQGRKIKNEFYDPEIDKSTGTKKQLVWVDVSSNTELLANDEYTQKSHLPYGTKTLLLKNGNQIIQGFLAEASVLGSGALQILNGETKNGQYRVFKLNQNNLSYNDEISYERFENGQKYKDLPLNTSENSYFSDSGLYLFTAHASSSIDNYKLVLIDKNLNAQKTKFIETINGLTRVQSFWETPVGNEFLNYLELKHNIGSERAKKMSYEMVLQYFVLFTNYIYKIQYYTQKNVKYISPFFKNVPRVYSYETFKNKYILAENGFNKFFNEYSGDFKYKELINISDMRISQDRRNLIINVSLKYNPNTNIFGYELVQSEITIPVSFIDNDVPEIFAKQVSFELNQSKIEDILLNSNPENWNSLIVNYDWLKDISLEDYQKASWFLEWEKVGSKDFKIKILGAAKSEFESEIQIVPKIKVFDLNLEKRAINLEEDQWEMRLKNTKINLAGLTENDQITKFIKKEIQETLSDLASIYDYELTNLNDILPYLSNINLASDVPLFYKVLNIKRKLDSKVFKIAIYNYVAHKYNKQFDLSEIKIDLLLLNTNDKELISKTIWDKVQEISNQRNISISDLRLINLEDVLRHLIAKNNKVSLIIGSNHYQLINNFKLEIQNNYKFDLKINETKLNERTAIDLTKISIPALNLNNKREFKDIQNEIILYVSNYFASFNLFWNYDYYIENINNPLFLKGLVNDLENTINIKIKSLNKKSNGETSLIVNNTLTELLTEKEQEKWNKIIEEFTNKVIGEAKKEPDYNPETSITDVLNNNTEIANKVDKDGINLISNDDLVKILDNNIINLNDFKVPLLRTYYDNSVDLANAIWDHINQNLTVKFTVNEYEFNQALKQLLIPSRENKTQLIIRGLYGFSSGVIPFEIINTTTENASYDNAISIKNDNNIINIIEEENKIQKQKAARNKKIWLGLTGGTALLGLISAGFIVWIRRFRNKLK